jgi:hypothetical protein
LKNNIISILDCIDIEDDPDEKFVFVIAPLDEDPTSDNNPVENA